MQLMCFGLEADAPLQQGQHRYCAAPESPTTKRSNDGVLLGRLVRRSQICFRRMYAADERNGGIDEQSRPNRDPANIEPDFIHDDLLGCYPWLKVIDGA